MACVFLSKEDAMHLCVGAKNPIIMRYRADRHLSKSYFKKEHEFLKSVGSYAVHYYYNNQYIWFKKKQDLLMYGLQF
jgi:UPF0288 family protein (methanogenesis marker protein 3)